MAKILIVDDEPSILSVLSTILRAEKYDVVPESNGEKVMDLVKNQDFDLLLCDIYMKPVGGMDILQFARQHRPAMSVIMLTAFGSVETAIKALKLGAFDYVTKPFKVDELLITVQRALEYRAALNENADLKAMLTTQYQLENIVAESASMKKVCEMVRRVAPTDTTILIYGESGTGKELVAKAIHANSLRKEKKFLAVNCAALPEPLLESEMFGHVKGAFTGASSDKEGLFEAARGGTIFLDEIGSMPLAIQGKLLRVLQEKEVRRVGSNENVPVDARVLAATNTQLEKLIKDGSFREDLYYRLSVIPINIAPLRERPEDILPVIYHVLRAETPKGKDLPSLEPDAARILETYPWPGNVRELENAIKHALAFTREFSERAKSQPTNKGGNAMSRKSGFTLVEIMIVVAIIGLLAAIAIPSFVKARDTSRQNACINNLRQIDSAKEQWAMANNIAGTAAVVTADVNGYIKGSATPVCPAAGTYTYNIMGTDPACTVSSPSHAL